MCTTFLSYKQNPHFPIVLASNRDEYYARPTAPASFWQDHPEIFAGRDLQEGGTWMGVNRRGCIAALTNFRDPQRHRIDALSRGKLVSEYLLADSLEQAAFSSQIRETRTSYNGYNILFGNIDDIQYYSNLREDVTRLKPGTYGLSNHLLDTAWPKVTKGKSKFAELILQASNRLPIAELIEMLRNDELAPDESLPETGVNKNTERQLSSIFVTIEKAEYGTRSSSVLAITADGKIIFVERTYQGKEALATVEEVFPIDYRSFHSGRKKHG